VALRPMSLVRWRCYNAPFDFPCQANLTICRQTSCLYTLTAFCWASVLLGGTLVAWLHPGVSTAAAACVPPLQGKLSNTEVDQRMVKALSDLPSELGLEAVDKFATSNLDSVRSKTGFMVRPAADCFAAFLFNCACIVRVCLHKGCCVMHVAMLPAPCVTGAGGAWPK
jgi:Heterogeneous nuclear ribonucleoprotein Q acidic domain